MAGLQNERARWIALNILPYEGYIRRTMSKWYLPGNIEIDDLIQEAYSKIAAMEDCSHIINAPSYFITTARRILLEGLRRAKVVPISSMFDVAYDEFSSLDPLPDQNVGDRQQLHQFWLAIHGLPEPGRSVLKMRVTYDLRYSEIGARVGMSENAVQKLIAKCLNIIGAEIGRRDPPVAGATAALPSLRVVKDND